MANYSVARAANKTLTTTAVDVVTFTSPASRLVVSNRAVGTTIWVTMGRSPADPVVGADNAIPVFGGTSVTIARGVPAGYIVKVVGSGDAYSVMGLPSDC